MKKYEKFDLKELKEFISDVKERLYDEGFLNELNNNSHFKPYQKVKFTI